MNEAIQKAKALGTADAFNGTGGWGRFTSIEVKHGEKVGEAYWDAYILGKMIAKRLPSSDTPKIDFNLDFDWQ